MFNLITEIKLFFIVLLVYVMLDLSMKLVLPTPYKTTYEQTLKNINGREWPTGAKLWVFLTLGYFIAAFGIYYFCVKESNYLNAVLFGIIIYGVYNSANVATINHYNAKLAAFDVAWGTTLVVLTTLISLLLSRFLTSTLTVAASSTIAPIAAVAPVVTPTIVPETSLETTTDIPSKGDDDLGLESDD